jgi:hypothetical protein
LRPLTKIVENPALWGELRKREFTVKMEILSVDGIKIKVYEL